MLCVLERLVALTEYVWPLIILIYLQNVFPDGVFKKIMFRFPVSNGEIEIAPSVRLYIFWAKITNFRSLVWSNLHFMWNQKLNHRKYRWLFRVASRTIIRASIILSLTCTISLVRTLWHFSWMAIVPSFSSDSSNDNLSLLCVNIYHHSWTLRVIFYTTIMYSYKRPVITLWC